MIHRLIAPVVAVAMTLVTASPASPDIPKVLQSVRAIQMVDVDEDTGEAHIHNICSTASIDETRRYWLTAAHCVPLGEKEYVNGEEVTVVMRDVINDVAVFSTQRVSAPALKLATRPVTYGDDIRIVGHPFGFPDAIITFGKVSNPSSKWTEEKPYDVPYMFINVAGAPGNSGSAVVNSKGEVVSVVQITFCGRGGFCPVLGGATFEVLKTYAKYFG